MSDFENSQKEVVTKDRKPLVVFIIMAVLVFALAGYIIFDSGAQKDAYVPAITTDTSLSSVLAPVTTIQIPKNESPTATAQEGSYVYVNEVAANSVVSITTEATVYSIFYGSYVESGAGSGVVFANSGNVYYILTNNHVVEGYSSIKVNTANGKEYKAEVIGTDWTTDIAVLRVETEDKLALVNIGDSANLKAGQNIAAIGNPLGVFGGTITPGIISAVTRELPIGGIPMTLIQHSASVSPGNSGGGLFNMQGQLIGIVNAKSSGDSVESIGFAIPINTAYVVASQIINQGYASGIPSLDITVSNRGNYIYVEEYAHNDLLEKSGQRKIERGDIIVSIDGQNITSEDSIRSAISKKEIGEKIELTLYGVVSNSYGFTSYETYTVELEVFEYKPKATQK